MAVTRTGIGQRNDTGLGEEEDVVTTTAAMLSREGAVHDATRGWVWTMQGVIVKMPLT